MTTETVFQFKSNAIRLSKRESCPSCSSRSHDLIYKLTRTNVFKCKNCGLEFIDPSLSPESMIEIYRSSDALKEINPALENYYEYELLNPRSRTFKDYTTALNHTAALVQSRRLLEVGCGGGEFLQRAKELGFETFGVDSAPENIARLKTKAIAGDCSDYLSFKPIQLFDVIVLWDLIEHPQDPLSFIKKSYELLNPGGLLLLATPCYPNLLSLLSRLFYDISGGAIKGPAEKIYFLEHTTYFGLKTLEHLLRRGNFEIARAWKTETDLARYAFEPLTRFFLRGAFLIARILGLQNRLLVLARKKV